MKRTRMSMYYMACANGTNGYTLHTCQLHVKTDCNVTYIYELQELMNPSLVPRLHAERVYGGELKRGGFLSWRREAWVRG